MRFSQEPSIAAFLKVYDKTPAFDREQLPFEAIALKARSNFTELLGAIILSFRSVQAQKSAVLAMEAHPRVVEATSKFAQQERGFQDRRMLHEAVGFVPTPKGASINFNFGQDEKPAPDQVSTPNYDELFPSISHKQEDWQKDRTKLLEQKR